MANAKKEQAIFSRDSTLNRLLTTNELAQHAQQDASVRKMFQVRYKFIEDHYQQFQRAQQKLFPFLTGLELADAENKSQIGDNAYFSSQTLFQTLFPKSENISVSRSNSPTQSNAINNNVKLPKLSLPHFDGNLQNWQTFRDMYNSLIHENDAISNVEKFQYLVSSLSGTALSLVSALPINNNNYNVAYNLLFTRYQNKRALASEHWRIIQNAPAVASDSPALLQKTLDIFTKNLSALDLLGFDTKYWDFVLFNLLLEKLDMETKKAFEKEYTKCELPTFDNLKTFVSEYSAALARVTCSTPVRSSTNRNINIQHNRQIKTHTVTINERCCDLCKQDHYLNQCPSFLNLSTSERFQRVKDFKLCINCFKNHGVKNCSSKFSCRECGQRHHTLLHFSKPRPETALSTNNIEIETENVEENPLALVSNQITASQTLLATAIVKIQDIKGKFHPCRCLLDSGSQSNFITEEFANKLGIPRSTLNLSVKGISQTALKVSSQIEVQIHSQYMAYNRPLSCLILPRITSSLPHVSFKIDQFDLPKDIALSDSRFNISNKIDVLIGASLFYDLILPEKRSLGSNKHLIAQETKLGWIVSGPINSISSFVTSVHVTEADSLADILVRFWTVEEPLATARLMSKEEKQCEDHFDFTTYRDETGRFVVRIPFNNLLSQLGESKSLALQRFYQLEKKLNRSNTLKVQYDQFLSEYEELGHMTEVSNENSPGYYIPHHAVIKDTSLTTKLRIVFNASMATSSGISLNQTQLVGPVVQSELLAIILRFRLYAYVFCGDVKKMYRQVLLHPDQRRYQRILWRKEPSEQIRTFELNTVTYGTASGAYLATKCIQTLATQSRSSFPLASRVLDEDMYVDDLITGADSIKSLVEIRNDVCNILSSGKFELRQFMSNDKRVLEGVSDEDELQVLDLGHYEGHKTLGVSWNSYRDVIQFNIDESMNKLGVITKRTILSTIASIFDPLGLVGPVIITAKILMQRLWGLKLGWDQVVPDSIQSSWSILRDSLVNLNSLRISRHVLLQNPISIQFHGFCDASENAYGACLYLRSADSLGNVCVHLLIAKSKVAPLKQLTLPRLELSGAYLLANLHRKTLSTMPNLTISKQYFWCDSTIALGWIRASPNKWQTFVANRVAAIQRCSEIDEWHHISSENNPADMISRGVNSSVLLSSELWWRGPPILSAAQIEILENNDEIVEQSNLPEMRTLKACCLVASTEIESNIFERFSDCGKLIRVIALILRWKRRVLNKEKLPNVLTVDELDASVKTLVRLAQRESFVSEIHSLKQHSHLSSNSKVLSLHPFLDSDGLMRVGGRLKNANQSYDVKHPLLLSNKHIFTEQLMRQEHIKLLHCGPQQLLYGMRRKYWPIGGKSLARKIVRSCVCSFRVKPIVDSAPAMGDLPE